MNTISVLIVDDHAMFRMGLKSLLGTCREITVVGDASNGKTAMTQIKKLKPAVVIMDLLMPEMDGVEATRQILAAVPETNILILTTFGTADGISHALSAGAKGALLKTAELAELKTAILMISAGRAYVSDEIKRIMDSDPPLPPLSRRQREVLESIVNGLPNASIADKLGISLEMVKEHVKALFAKLNVSTRADAVAIALRKHLLKI